jgi:RNA polymerase sigma-70 factor (ECF subfamily)
MGRGFSVFGHSVPCARNPPGGTRVNQASQKQTGISEPTTRVNERQLIAAAVAGEVTAQRMLYDQHVDRVYRLAYRLAGEDELARDFTQETFIRAFQRLKDFRSDSSFGTWIHTIAMSVSLNGLRKVKKFRTRESSLDDALTVGVVTRRAEPDLKERLRRAIDNLPEGYRTVFVMHDVEGYTHEEIGEALGVQPGTSKAQLFRARAKLREALADFAGEWVS